MSKLVLAALIFAPVLAGCGDSGSLLSQSCSGKAIPNCRAYDYSVISAASITPAGLYALQTSTATIHVKLGTCGAKKLQRHDVSLEAILSTSVTRDGGSGEQRTVSLTTFRDDGTRGDSQADDDSIDITITNPFVGTTIPDNTDITLRFRSSSIRGAAEVCSSPEFDIPYRTGRAL